MPVPVSVPATAVAVSIPQFSIGSSVDEDPTPKISRMYQACASTSLSTRNSSSSINSPVFERVFCGEKSKCARPTRKKSYNGASSKLLLLIKQYTGEQHADAYPWRCITVNITCEQDRCYFVCAPPAAVVSTRTWCLYYVCASIHTTYFLLKILSCQ